MDPARINLTEDRFGLTSLAFRPGNRATLQGLEHGDLHWSVDILIQPHDDVQTVEIDDSGQKVSRRLPAGEYFTGLEILAEPGVEAYKLVATFALTGLELRGAGLPQKKAFAEILREAAADRSWPLELRIVDESRNLRLTEQGRVILRDLADRLEAEGRVATGLMISRKLEVPAGTLEALRKRISRRSLQAYKVRDRWYVALENLTREPRQPAPAPSVATEAVVEPGEPDGPAEELPVASDVSPESTDSVATDAAAISETFAPSRDTATTEDEPADVSAEPASAAENEELPEAEITTQFAYVSADDTQAIDEPSMTTEAPEPGLSQLESEADAQQLTAAEPGDQHEVDAEAPVAEDAGIVDDAMRDVLEQEAAAVDAFFVSSTEATASTDYLYTRVQEHIQISVATDVAAGADDDVPVDSPVPDVIETTQLDQEIDASDNLADAGDQADTTEFESEDVTSEEAEPISAAAALEQPDETIPSEPATPDVSAIDAPDAAVLETLIPAQDDDLSRQAEAEAFVESLESDAADVEPGEVDDSEYDASLDVATAPDESETELLESEPASAALDDVDTVPGIPEAMQEPKAQPDALEPISAAGTPEPETELDSYSTATMIEDQEVAADATLDTSTEADLSTPAHAETLEAELGGEPGPELPEESDLEVAAGQDAELVHELPQEEQEAFADEPVPAAEPFLAAQMDTAAEGESGLEPAAFEQITTDTEAIIDQWDAEPDQAATWDEQAGEVEGAAFPDDLDTLIDSSPAQADDIGDQDALDDVLLDEPAAGERFTSEEPETFVSEAEQQDDESVAADVEESPGEPDQEFQAASYPEYDEQREPEPSNAEFEDAAEDVLLDDNFEEQLESDTPQDQPADAVSEPELSEPRSAEERVLFYLREEVIFLRQQVQEKDRQIAAWAAQTQRLESATQGREKAEPRVMKSLNRKNGNGTGYQLLSSDLADSSEQLGAIRDEWLQPLIDQIRYLEHQVGRMQGERSERHSARVAELQTEKEALTQRLAALETELVSVQQQEKPRLPWYRRIW